MENSLVTTETDAPALSAGTAAAVAREQHEIQGMMTLAKKFPRDEVEATGKLRQSFQNVALAEAAEYHLEFNNRKTGKVNKIEGPSIEAAREMLRIWGNMKSGSSIVDMDAEYIHIEAYAIDLETNASNKAQDKFRRQIQRYNKYKKVTEWVDADERHIQQEARRRGAPLERNCILHLLPKWFVQEGIDVAHETLKRQAADSQKWESAKVRLIRRFKTIGVSLEQLNKRLGHSFDELSQAEYEELLGIGKAIKDEEKEIGDYFEVKEENIDGNEKTLQKETAKKEGTEGGEAKADSKTPEKGPSEGTSGNVVSGKDVDKGGQTGGGKA